MRFNKQLSHSLVASLFIFSTAAAPLAHAGFRHPANTLSAVDIQQIDDLITQLNSTDARQSSAAAKTLGSYQYQEVQNALVSTLKRIINDHSVFKGYSFTVTAGLESLAKISTQADAKEIADLRQEWESNRYNPALAASSRHIDGYFDQLEAALKTRKPANPTYKVKPRAGQVPTLRQLIDQLDDATKMAVEKMLMGGVEEVTYDKSVEAANKNAFPKYYGRENELEKLVQSLLRLEKGHAMLTGKAGVGKTTIMKMLSNGWLEGTIPFRGAEAPIVLELTITDITNPSDPSAIKARIAGAQLLAQKLNRHIVLFIDEAHISTSMTRNAIKNFLTKELDGIDNRVHFVWATTSSESRSFLSDSAFARRWVEVFVEEFTNAQAIEAVKAAFLPKWRTQHSRGGIAFTDISQEAYDFAVKYSSFEQPNAGNPTGVKELLEGTIVFKMRELEKLSASGVSLSPAQRNFTLDVHDLRNYMTFQLGIKLMPGDPNFETKFEEIWRKVDADYVGNEGLMHQQKEKLKAFFGSLTRKQMMAQVLLGPPGAGKSYLPEVMAKHFFNNKPLVVNLAEYSEGGLSLNKLIGSPTGTVGSEEQRSVLTKYIKDNPRGGIIVFEEADFGHKDVFNFLVDMITSGKFTDGLGQEYKTDRFMLFFNTNVGQDRMINRESKGKAISWEDVEMRRRAITTEIVVDGKRITIVRPDVAGAAFEEFIKKINDHSNPGGDTRTAADDGEKLKRRLQAFYVLPPEQKDLLEAAKRSTEKWVRETKLEYGVDVKITDAEIEKILDLKSFRFEMGHGFVNQQLENRLFSKLTPFLSKRGQVIDVDVTVEQVPHGKRMLDGYVLNVSTGGQTTKFSLGVSVPQVDNPWSQNADITKRIQTFPQEMVKRIQGQDAQIATLFEMLRQKRLNWNSRIVFTQIGTSGNGKTEFGYSMAEVLFGSRSAAFKISGIQNWGDLNNYFRSDTGFVGSNQETDFERWFMARKTLGGGVIILDELLSFSGMSREGVGAKVEAINKLYDMLDEGIIKFGNRKEDARGFVIEVTGNAMQELFNGIDDSPESERLVKRILEKVTSNDIAKYFASVGMDAPKVARLGPIFVNGPLSQEASQRVGAKEVKRAVEDAIRETSQLYDLKVEIDPAIVNEVVKRVTTVKLGMRKVNEAIRALVIQPVTGIMTDFEGVGEIKAKLVNGKIVWTADGAEVVKHEMSIGTAKISTWTTKDGLLSGSTETTPQLKDVTEQPKVRLSQAEVYRVAIHEIYGHWLADYLLTGRNNAETISLIPGDGYLGYVRPKENLDSYDGKSLTTWLREAVMLESGARATFIAGFYSSGGGSNGAPRNMRETQHDDLGRVEQTFNEMLSNQIFRNVTEFSNEAQKTEFKEFMRSVTKGMSDRIIRYGLRTKQFKGIFEEVLKERFINDVRLEEMIQKVDRSKLMSPEHLLFWSMSNATVVALERAKKEGADAREIGRLTRLATELVQKTSTEITAQMKLRGQQPDKWMIETKARALAKINAAAGSRPTVRSSAPSAADVEGPASGGGAPRSCSIMFHGGR